VPLPEGFFKDDINQVVISININGHMYWIYDGRQILASVFLDFSRDDPVIHVFESFPVDQSPAS
jgi:hypothetical protein